MATFPNAIFSVFRQCLSSTRRRQFDREQRLSLLNTEGDLEKLRPIDRDSAALELRRRLQLQEFYDDDDDYNFDRQLTRETEEEQPQDEDEEDLDGFLKDIEQQMDQISGKEPNLRHWLMDIDPSKRMEYVTYANAFESQGFETIDDLRSLSQEEIPNALSAVGVTKFSHKSKLLKAISSLDNQ